MLLVKNEVTDDAVIRNYAVVRNLVSKVFYFSC